MTDYSNHNLPETSIPKTEVKSLDVNFQMWITDADPMQIAFFKKFCGWVENTKRDKSNFLGEQIEKTHTEYDVNWYARMCNEAGGSFLYASCYPLISPLLTTSTLEKDQITRLWDIGMDSLTEKLLDSVFTGVKMVKRDDQGKPIMIDGLLQYIVIKNPYEIDFISIPEIITYCLLLYGITNKAKGGFTMTKLADSFVKTEIARTGVDTRDKPDNGIFSTVGKLFGSKGGSQ